MMVDTWEAFTPRSRPRMLEKDQISLTKSNILLSQELAEEFDARWVVLLFKPVERELGLRPAAEGERAYKLSGRAVSWRSFREHFDITERGRYTARVENGMLVCSLKRES